MVRTDDMVRGVSHCVRRRIHTSSRNQSERLLDYLMTLQLCQATASITPRHVQRPDAHPIPIAALRCTPARARRNSARAGWLPMQRSRAEASDGLVWIEGVRLG